MKKLFTIWLLAIPCLVFSQDELVDTTNFDVELFNKYVLEEVNMYRKRERVDKLSEDPSLDQAAQDHADYIAENRVLSHQQKNKLKHKPYDRVIYYGGTHEAVGENLQIFPLYDKVIKFRGRLTYERLARELVVNWKKSSGHYENMVRKEFEGVTHKYVIKDGMLYAVQVLASRPFEENYAFEKGNTLHVKDKNECWNCKRFRKKVDKDEAHLGWYTVSNDSIYYWNTDIVSTPKNKLKKGNLRRLFSAKGAIAVDVIHQEQFSCNGNKAFDNALYYDGYYIGYVSKAKLKDDINPSPAIVQVYVGQKPAFVDTFFQVDFNLVKRWRPCMHGMTIYVHPDYLQPEEYFEIPKPRVIAQNIVVTDSVSTVVPFKSGQTDEDTSIFHPLINMLDSLVEQQFNIKSIYFDGVASIEGTQEGNELLFKRRGLIIRDYLKKFYPDYELESEFYENFDDFRSGLVSLGVQGAIDMTDDSLRWYANRNKSQFRISNLLDQTRFSSVRIIYEDQIPLTEGGYGLSVKRLQELIEAEEVRDMVPLYEVLAHTVMDGNESKKDSLLDLNIPESETFGKLHWYDFVLRMNLGQAEVTTERLNHLKELGGIPTDAKYLEYRLMFSIFYKTNNIDLSDFSEVFGEMRSKRDKAWIECLELIKGVESYRYAHAMVAPIIVEKALNKKFDLKKTYFICQYLIEWGYTTEPYILLSKYARRGGLMPKVYKQYLKLAYFLGQFDKKKEWKRIRTVMARLANDHPTEFCDLFKWNQMGVRALRIPEIAELFCEKCRTETP